MLRRLGWFGCALSAGLLLQIAIQIRALGWLPDFPVYIALAVLAGLAAICGVGAPFHRQSRWAVAMALLFVVSAEGHAILALYADSTVIALA
jgi:hypothetical protein